MRKTSSDVDRTATKATYPHLTHHCASYHLITLHKRTKEITTDTASRKSLWKKEEDDWKTKIKDTVYAGHGRYGRNPNTIRREGNSNNFRNKYNSARAKRLLNKRFNFESEECAIATFKQPRDKTRVARNMYAWKKKRGMRSNTKQIRISELREMCDEESAEVMFAERILSNTDEHEPALIYSDKDDDHTNRETQPRGKNIMHRIMIGGNLSDDSSEESSYGKEGF